MATTINVLANLNVAYATPLSVRPDTQATPSSTFVHETVSLSTDSDTYIRDANNFSGTLWTGIHSYPSANSTIRFEITAGTITKFCELGLYDYATPPDIKTWLSTRIKEVLDISSTGYSE